MVTEILAIFLVAGWVFFVLKQATPTLTASVASSAKLRK